ncbi:dehydrogenase [Pseudomonas fluorescens]|uniref:SDR family oxidoreductase n=1 Tax=Pseudomonas lactucae TaxID=2813360 RepID=A0A9X1C995_9PSED|nr:SDR family oxidoreductase [Pseudomonas lactucae]OPA94039.1 dehydrogenase [Pseudomonas fluorescens]MBN2979505.1 SDR family oxidoreductase [Pseudomonas lactucae]MBN2986692.1 SDR family oxidoreductase [Pseudomonas lactucae]OPB12024.1 dehydrogenase [Pseudomonas fluorescens]OPB24052.1 dehydrogenase [Pseudomonas fluorescens]
MKKLIITGAANGIGRATVEQAIQQGYFVIGADKDADGLYALQRLYGADVLEVHVADFSDSATLKGFIAMLYERHATIYGLINNAGIYHGKSIYHYCDDEIDEILNVNLKALVYLSKDFAEREMRHEAPRSIVNIASVAGEVGSCDAMYGATKAAVIGLTKANAWNFAPFVRVNAVSPALIHDTAIYDTIPEYRRAEYARQEILKEPILPGAVAEVILLLAGDAMRHISGRVIPVDNGAYPR